MSSLDYLYRDADIFAVYKPAGINSVRAGDSGGHSIADLLLAETPALRSVGSSGIDAGLVTRLDRSTSGILLGASSPTVWRLFHEQVLAGGIDKRYVAYVEGHFPDRQSITTFIGSPHRGAKKMKLYTSKPSKSARALEGSSHFNLLSYDSTLDMSLVEISAAPARRHQIRLHAAFLGHPLVGDTLYGSNRTLSVGTLSVGTLSVGTLPIGTPSRVTLPLVLGEPRDFFLHAYRVVFYHPCTAALVTIESPYERGTSSGN